MSNINFEADKFSEASLNGGTLYVTALNATTDAPEGGYRSLGYCDGVEIAASDETVDLKSSLTGPRSTAVKALLERTLNVTITLRDVQPENLALALAGTVSAAAAEAGRVETGVAYLGKLLPLDFSIDESGTAPVVTDDTGATTYEEGLNYVLNKGSIVVLADQTGATNPIADGDELEITYDANKSQIVQGYTESGVNVGLYFEGFNQANDNATFKGWMHKVYLSPSSNYSLLSTDDFATLTIEGELLASRAISGAGASKFFKQTVQDLSA